VTEGIGSQGTRACLARGNLRGMTAAFGGAGRPRGFTLLELLITLSVTTIGLIGLLSLHLSISRGNDGASRSAEAQQITAMALETLRGLRIGTDPGDPGNPNLMQVLVGNPNAVPPAAPGITAPAFTVPGRGGVIYSVTRSVVALPSASTGLWRIRVDTSWTEQGAGAGASGGQFDHHIALEVIRTVQESL
jgi:prepilin-type N-terminal cleavage/methylation domain-containing protein